MGKRMLLQGNEAVVEGALAAGMRLFAGYPITPSTEIAEQAALKLPLYDGHFIQMEDEISSMAASDLASSPLNSQSFRPFLQVDSLPIFHTVFSCNLKTKSRFLIT